VLGARRNNALVQPVDVSYVSTGALAVHVNFALPVCLKTQDEIAQVLTKAGRSISRQKTENPDITALIERLNQDPSPQEKDEVRDQLKCIFLKGLEADGIPPKIAKSMTMVFANSTMQDIDLSLAVRSESIILYLKCQSVETLLRLKEMVLSGLLLWLLNDVIKQFIDSQHRIHLVIKAEDYNATLFCLNSVTGKFVISSVFRYIVING